jgi:dynein heavy chain
MTVPDSEFISEILLFTEGFVNSKVLASKLVRMYRLCSEQLSPQVHYDFGLRSIKSVLILAGSVRREHPDMEEEMALIQAIRASNGPKFLPGDLPLFNSILLDLFPGIKSSAPPPKSLQNAIQASLQEKLLEPISAQVEKIMQLYDTLKVRHGIMLVGPTGSGKTTIYQVLASALKKLDVSPKSVVTQVLNPKAVSISELYGVFDEISREWTDGLAANVVRTAISNEDTSALQWIVFDGPVDAIWIENMNSVLDDNKLFCLANGERMKLSDQISMIFEVDDLSAASPATISRCGMIYVGHSTLGWKPTVNFWLEKLQNPMFAAKAFKDYVLRLCGIYYFTIGLIIL